MRLSWLVIALVTGFGLLPSSAGAVAFSDPFNFGVGLNPEGIAVGDFDGDSDPDLAVSNWESDNVSVLLGNGSGGFGAAANFGVGNAPQGIAIGDFNGDSDPDLAVANRGGDNVSVLLGGAGGSFTGPTNFGAGSAPSDVAVGDFDGDPDPDLAVANANSDNVSILLGSAGGSFGPPTDFSAGNRPEGVAIGDFNGDSDPDLAVANAFSNDVSVLLGNGSGGFAGATAFAASNSPRSVAVGNFDADSDADLAVANAESNDVSILFGNGAGGFGAAVNFGAGGFPRAVATGDLDGDADPDLVTANAIGDDASVLFGDGAGSFGGLSMFGAGSGPSAVAVEDFNGDARPDLAVANRAADNVSILYGQTEPAISTESTASAVAGQPISNQAVLAGGEGPTGTISFSLYGPDDATCGGAPAFTDTVPVSGNGPYASAGLIPAAVGTYRWIAEYSGDQTNAGAASDCADPAALVTIAKAASETKLSSSRSPAPVGEAVTFEATVSGFEPSGEVTFRDGATVLGTSAVDASGKAGLSTSALRAGTHEIHATYAGDGNNHGSASGPVSQVVQEPAKLPAPPSPPAARTPSPEVRLTYHPNRPHEPNPRGGPRYTFRFTDAAPGVTFHCRLDRRAFKPCSSPTVYRNLKRGRHVFQVKSVDAAGSESALQTVRFRAGARR